jgi:hypothetical protein
MYRLPAICAGFYDQLLADSKIDNRLSEHASSTLMASIESRRAYQPPIRRLAAISVRSGNGGIFRKKTSRQTVVEQRDRYPLAGHVPADSFPMLAHKTGKCNAIAKRLRTAFFGC